MPLLGHFKYHLHQVSFSGNETETEYVVETASETLSGDEVERHLYHFNQLWEAREAFVNAVNYILYYTSASDVSLYQQHRA